MKKSKEGRCQCCHNILTKNSHLVFDEEGRTLNIATLLFNYIKKSLNENDGLNYAICDPCWQQLIKYNDFQQKCILANEMASDEDDVVEDDDYELVNMQVETDGNNDKIQSNHNETSEFYASGESQERNINFDYQYECDEELVDDMQIEYLDENDPVDEESWYNHENNAVQLANVGQKKSIPFDFQPVLVKPIFMFGIGNSFSCYFFLFDYNDFG